MPEFLQIVITKKDDDSFHIFMQNDKEVVRSEYPEFYDAVNMLLDALVDPNFSTTQTHRTE